MVHENGDIIQYVDEAMRAFHAGKSPWQGETDMNSVSIGIELVNLGDVAGYPPFSPAQITATMALCRDIMRRHPAITPQNVLGHQDIAPERKLDPGPAFPWAQFEAAGIAKRLPPPH
jgi:N-acetylmuramoyl-L-alanine amidase